MEKEIENYAVAVRSFEDYCTKQKLGWHIDVQHYPISVTVYQSGEYGHAACRLTAQQREIQDKVPCCTWAFIGGVPILHPKNNWVMGDKTMTRLRNLAQKVKNTFLEQYFARAYCEVVEE